MACDVKPVPTLEACRKRRAGTSNRRLRCEGRTVYAYRRHVMSGTETCHPDKTHGECVVEGRQKDMMLNNLLAETGPNSLRGCAQVSRVAVDTGTALVELIDKQDGSRLRLRLLSSPPR